MAAENPQPIREVDVVSEEVRDARFQVLSTDQIVQANMEAAEAVEKGEVFYGGTK